MGLARSRSVRVKAPDKDKPYCCALSTSAPYVRFVIRTSSQCTPPLYHLKMVYIRELICLPVNAGQVAASATGSSASNASGEAGFKEQLEVKQESEDSLGLERDLG